MDAFIFPDFKNIQEKEVLPLAEGCKLSKFMWTFWEALIILSLKLTECKAAIKTI